MNTLDRLIKEYALVYCDLLAYDHDRSIVYLEKCIARLPSTQVEPFKQQIRRYLQDD